MKRFLPTAAAALLLTVACGTTDVHGTADSDVQMASQDELAPCCKEAAVKGEKECCENLEGVKVCPVTGQVSKE